MPLVNDDCEACGHTKDRHQPVGLIPRTQATYHCRVSGCGCVQYELPPVCERCHAPLDAEGHCPDPLCRAQADLEEMEPNMPQGRDERDV